MSELRVYNIGGADFIVRGDPADKKDTYPSGARRDTQLGKPRYDLISPKALLREAYLMARGAAKYGDRNWEQGMPQSRFLASLMRHVEAYRLGDNVEDHLSAVRFNAAALVHFEGTKWADLSGKVDQLRKDAADLRED